MSSASVGRPASASDATGSVALPEDPSIVGTPGMELTYEHGVELEARTSGRTPAALLPPQARRSRASSSSSVSASSRCSRARSLRTRRTGSLLRRELPQHLNQAPSLDFPFGTDQLGRDYFSRVIYGVQTSLGVAIVVALLATFIGTLIGAVAGYYGGAVDNGLMRFTDLILTVPGLAVLLVAAAYLGSSAVEVPFGSRRSAFRSRW